MISTYRFFPFWDFDFSKHSYRNVQFWCKLALIVPGQGSAKLKTMLTDCSTVCSKGCLLMSEPTWERGEGDKVRAASHASWPSQGIGVGGEGCVGSAGAGGVQSQWLLGWTGTQLLNVGWFKRRGGDVKFGIGPHSFPLCLTYIKPVKKTKMAGCDANNVMRMKLYHTT